MLFLEDKFVWVDEIKDSEIINWYYNMFHLGRYIESHKKQYIDDIIEKWEANPFHRNKPVPSTDISGYIDLEIISSHHRNVMSIFDIDNITTISAFLKSIDEFTDLILFMSRLKNNSGIGFIKNSIKVLEENNKKIFIDEYFDNKIEIELSAISKGSSGNVILDMLEGGKDKYVTLFTLNIYDKVYTLISDENPVFTPEDKIILSRFCDDITKRLYRVMCEITCFLIKNYNESYTELISYNLSRGKIYV